MLTTKTMQEEILRLKKENDICILAHAYQSHDILEVADYVGDSYGLSLQAAKDEHKTVIMCGVRFMAETCKILCPDKKVILSHSEAGCPMAEQLTVDELRKLREQYPDYTVVAYINTTSALKTLCDVCVTSSQAVEIVRNIKNDKIMFIPDCNLGAWVQKELPEKTFQMIQGGCPIHLGITEEDVIRAKKAHPEALLLVHPECKIEVTSQADYAGSTTGIMSYVGKTDAQEYIIGTENSILQHLQFEYPQKKFYPLSKKCICHDMKLTTLAEVYQCVLGTGGEEILLDEETMTKAKKCIDTMIELGA